MTKNNAKSNKFSELRKRAESGRECEATELPPDEDLNLVHELRTHQIELEMQNEELRRTQKELVESHNRYTDLYDFAPIGYVTITYKGLIIEANLTLAEMLGVERQALINRLFTALITPDDKDIYYMHRQKILKSKQRETCQIRMLRCDASPFWVEIDSVMIEDDDERNIQIRTVINDITVRKRVETELLESERSYRNIFSTSAISILEEDFTEVQAAIRAVKAKNVTDFRMYLDHNPQFVDQAMEMVKVLNVNAKALSMYQAQSKEKFLNVFAQTLVSPSVNVFREVLIAIAEGKSVFEAETVIRTLLGEHRDVLIKIALPESGDAFNRVLVSIVDITDRKKMEMEILKTQKLESIGILAGGIAHDFNNLLTMIIGNVSLVKKRLTPGEKSFIQLSRVENASNQAQKLTQRLLTFSTGGEPLREAIPTEKLLRETVEFSLSGSKASFEFTLLDGLNPLGADYGQISQAIQNLIINANQAMPKGGVIKIQAENITVTKDDKLPLDDGDYVKISISDQGIGIPAVDQEKIFDPFFTTKQKGYGLGLATVFSIINNHSGYITFESKVGSGTTFYVFLPVSQEDIDVITDDYSVPCQNGETILVMDDEEAIREYVDEILSGAGYNVRCAKDGTEALEIYKEGQISGKFINVVILDLTVRGGMGGEETITNLLKIDPGAKVIVSSGYSNNLVLTNFREYGFIAAIKKPFKPNKMLEVIAKTIQS